MFYRRAGFTLVEMSIVLVVIGLIIGGVLVGRDLIASATIRATVAQREKFDTAANTFRSKYGCLPGDCRDVSAFSTNAASAGDGNGRIGAAPTDFITGAIENSYFWEHMQSAGLINDPFTLSGGSNNSMGVTTPKAKIISPINMGGWGVVAGAYFDATYGGGGFPQHSLVLSGGPANVYFGGGYGYLPADIYAIDKKIDDGLPTSGSVRAYVLNWDDDQTFSSPIYKFGCDMHGFCVWPPGPAGGTTCITNDTPAKYNIPFATSSLINATGLCGAVMKASF